MRKRRRNVSTFVPLKTSNRFNGTATRLANELGLARKAARVWRTRRATIPRQYESENLDPSKPLPVTGWKRDNARRGDVTRGRESRGFAIRIRRYFSRHSFTALSGRAASLQFNYSALPLSLSRHPCFFHLFSPSGLAKKPRAYEFIRAGGTLPKER